MNDQELARQIVAHLGGDGPNNYAAYSIVIDGIAHWMPAEKLVNDWCVAGAMMELVGVCCKWDKHKHGYTVTVIPHDIEARNESLPRAINEACVLKLDGESQ